MITHFTISNFKRLKFATLDFDNTVVFIGPNNSGKTSAWQAITLWDVGWKRWVEKRDLSVASKRTGVTINRRDLYPIPIPSARLLWHDLHTQETQLTSGKVHIEKSYITLTAEGVHNDENWICAMEFYYANTESFYCRLKDSPDGKIPAGVRNHSVIFLPPMSGLTEREYRKESGEISVLIGEGRTAEVLRNLCWQLFSKEDKNAWKILIGHIYDLFHIELQNPCYFKERAELTLAYREASGVELDVSSSGRGCQQVLLLLSYMLSNPGAILLLDEPDAHLEILRQRDVYNLLTEVAAKQGSQIIAASHSEVILQEAAGRDVVMAFVGKPHRIDNRSRFQVKKALETIRMADYYLAEQQGWLLYVEGSTDLAILRRLAQRLNHPAQQILNDSVPVIYLGSNQPHSAREHFHGLREAKSDLVGLVLFDRLDKELQTGSQLVERMWSRREIENYLVTPASLQALIQIDLRHDDLIAVAENRNRCALLETCINELIHALQLTNKPDPWGPDIKVTDDFLDPLFKLFYQRLGTPQRIFKRDYHDLADVIPITEIAPEINTMLDHICTVANAAQPTT